MRGALVGYGTIGAAHHEAYQAIDDLDIVAIIDPSERRQSIARARDAKIVGYGSLDALLHAQQVDFVDICAPPSMHLELLLMSLDAGCHVICEKPFVLRQADCRTLLQAASRSDRLVYPSHNYRFSPVSRYLFDRTRSEAFGRIVRAYFRTIRNGHARGVDEWRPDWRRMSRYSGGGIVQDHAPHSIYLACYLCGGYPTSVSCVVGNMVRNHFQETEDTAAIRLDFADRTEVHVDLTWASGFRHTSYALLGTRQNIVVDNDRVILTDAGHITESIVRSDFDDPRHQDWFTAMFRDFQASVGSSSKRESLLAEAWATCATVEAAYSSSQAGGQTVQIDPLPQGFA